MPIPFVVPSSTKAPTYFTPSQSVASGGSVTCVTAFVSKADATRVALHKELTVGLLRVPEPLRIEVLRLGGEIVGATEFVPHALNLTCAEDGSVLFTLFGADGREAELWIGEQPDRIAYVVTEAHGAGLREGDVAIGEYGRVARWLRGGTNEI